MQAITQGAVRCPIGTPGLRKLGVEKRVLDARRERICGLRNGLRRRNCQSIRMAAQTVTGSNSNGQVAVEAPKAEPPAPNVFDGTTRLYYSPACPYAQRLTIAVNFKGLDDIERVEIDPSNKPSWYKEKVYSAAEVPALEHNNKVMGESLDLLQYLDEHFPGPKLLPEGSAPASEVEELIKLCDSLVIQGYLTLSDETLTPMVIEDRFGPSLNALEQALAKSGTPFFFVDFGFADILYLPFLERLSLAFSNIRDYEVTTGRPHLARWLQACDKVRAYKDTKLPQERILGIYQKMLEIGYFKRIFSARVAAQ